MAWFYISFADEVFHGAVYVEAGEPDFAPLVASEHGINPGGEAWIVGPLSDSLVRERIPPHDRYRLLSREDLEATGGVMTQSEFEAELAEGGPL